MLVILFAVVANGASGLVPPLRDEVRVTALGEKNDKARREEVYIANYTVDGETVEAEEPVEGNWYWGGKLYCWRADYDDRRPAEITDSIVLEVPVGWERTINFEAHEWRGLAQIQSVSVDRVVDLYRESKQIVSEDIGSSASKDLILDQIRKLAVYLLVLTALSAGLLPLVKRCSDDPGRIVRMLEDHWETLVLLAVSGGVFCVLWRLYPSADNFYYDQVVTIGMAKASSLSSAMDEFLYATLEPPLSFIFSYFYYKYLPWIGPQSLFLLPNLYIAASVYLTGKMVSKYTSKPMGIFAALMVVASVTVMQYGENMRSYSMSILLSVPLLWAYANLRTKSDVRRKDHCLFVLAILAVAYCNYHGIVSVVGIFLIDVFLFLRRKLTWRFLLPYCAAGVCFVPFFLTVVKRLVTHMAGWRGVATWHFPVNQEFLKNLTTMLGGQNKLMIVLMLCSFALMVYLAVSRKALNREYILWTVSAYWVILQCVVLIGWALFHPDNTMLQYRYFSSVFIPAVLASVGVVYCLMRHITNLSDGALRHGCTYASFALSAVMLLNSAITLTSKQDTARGNWLTGPELIISDTDVYYQTSCVCACGNARIDLVKTCMEYMMYRNGVRSAVNCITFPTNAPDELSKYKKIYTYDATGDQVKTLEGLGFQQVAGYSRVRIFAK